MSHFEHSSLEFDLRPPPCQPGLSAARYQAEEIIRHEYGPLTSEDEDDGDEDDEPASAGDGRW
jgi:hypothetical protein